MNKKLILFMSLDGYKCNNMLNKNEGLCERDEC